MPTDAPTASPARRVAGPGRSGLGLAAALSLLGGAWPAHPVRAANPPAFNTPADHGRRLWLELNCYGCHGMHAGGQIAINIQGLGALVPSAVNGGYAGLGMPNFASHLSGSDISDLQAYVDVAGTANEPTFLQWWRKNPRN